MIVLTAPTGVIGRRVLADLARLGEPVRVIARRPQAIPAKIRAKVEIVEGSHGVAGVVDRAFDGAHTVFWSVPPDPRAASLHEAYVEFSRPASVALSRRDVERVVAVSVLGRGTPLTAGYASASLAMEDLLASTGVVLRSLALPSFMENTLRQATAIRDRGIFTSPIAGDRKLPVVAVRDIADAAVRLIRDTGWDGQDSVPVLGAEDVSHAQMADIIADVVGLPVRFEQLSWSEYKTDLVALGMSPAMAQGMVDMLAAKESGLDQLVARDEDTSSPTTFRHWCGEVLKPALLEPAADARLLP